MDSNALTTIVGGILAVLAPAAPYLQAAGMAAATEAGKQSLARAKALYERIAERFKRDGDEDGSQTLALYLKQPARFESALAGALLDTLKEHPEWATEIRALLAEPSTQEIIARNNSTLERVTQSLVGSGSQTIDSDNSTLKGVTQTKRDY